ncbi:Uncharacterised protein [Vibrio cholerae]|uniref:Uncharacterized protein n=1 Tax=Vibrio cholerae TaxID=666 RepID=A0A655Q9U4_VIBCL|nr:Uncharacterised protein [Vibrio cholerae]CSA38634.1 Uncharacterised protein [Vibrio cholerae]
MADEQDRGVINLIHATQQTQNLRLSDGVHVVGGFICDQQFRFSGNGHRNHHFLTLAIRQLIRVARHDVFVIFDADFVQQSNRLLFPPCETLPPASFEGVKWDGLNQLSSNLFRWIKTGGRLLENHCHIACDHASAFTRGELQQINIAKTHTVSRDAPVFFTDTDNRFRNQALT